MSAGTPHFKRFVQILRESGCDLSHVSINKGLVTIGAIEQYGAMRKRRNSVIEHVKAALVPGHNSPHELEKQRDEERKEAGRRAEKTKLVWEDLELPHDGRKIEELTMDERIERGAAVSLAENVIMGEPELMSDAVGCKSAGAWTTRQNTPTFGNVRRRPVRLSRNAKP